MPTLTNYHVYLSSPKHIKELTNASPSKLSLNGVLSDVSFRLKPFALKDVDLLVAEADSHPGGVPKVYPARLELSWGGHL